MASIFKRTNRGKQAEKYSIRFLDHKDGKDVWRTVAGYADKEATRKKAQKLETEAGLKRDGVVREVDTKGELPIDAFRRHLEAKKRSESHVALTIHQQLTDTFTACGFSTLKDLRQPDAADEINRFLNDKKRKPRRKATEELTKRVEYAEPEKLEPISARTRNAYIVAIKSFCKWCLKTDQLPDCKLIHVLERAKESKQPVRRAADDAELDRILTAARNGEPVAGLSGEERYWLYRVATATGFRASELRKLTPAHFKLRVSIPHIALSGDDTKNGQDAYQPIRPELAAELAGWLRGRTKDEPVWPGLCHKKAADMMRVDLEAAGVPYRADGRVLDFHALRGTFITSLSRAGVHPKTAQILARHSDIKLTMQTYTHLSLAEVAAVLPERAPNAQKGDGKTGQNGASRGTTKGRRQA